MKTDNVVVVTKLYLNFCSKFLHDHFPTAHFADVKKVKGNFLNGFDEAVYTV